MTLLTLAKEQAQQDTSCRETLFHIKCSLHSASRVRRNPNVISTGVDNPVHLRVIGPEIIRLDGEIDRLVLART